MKKKIYVVIDKDFESYNKEDVIKGYFDSREESSKLCDELNLKHYLKLEAKVPNSQISSRYVTMLLVESIDYIVNRINPLNNS